jgi:hypothetical protein
MKSAGSGGQINTAHIQLLYIYYAFFWLTFHSDLWLALISRRSFEALQKKVESGLPGASYVTFLVTFGYISSIRNIYIFFLP